MHHQTPSESAAQCERFIRLPECLHMVGLGRTAWLDLVKAGTAPQPVKSGRATLWVWSEVQGFIAARIRESRGLR
ncbi:MAG: AlpA family phage regulatory protein [Burkholderiaceae bacterium]